MLKKYKKIFLLILFVLGFFPFAGNAAPIIINHESVALYDKIPDQYMTTVKQMWFNMPGESHSRAYYNGLIALQSQNSKYKVSVSVNPGTGNVAGDGLAINYDVNDIYSVFGSLWNGNGWDGGAGEEDWFYGGATKPQGHITKVNGASYRASILGLGWCWDAGLTPTDFDNYVNATQGYSTYAKSLGSKVHIVFTTGPVDGGGSVVRDQKYAKVRTHVNNSTNEILFDYADILEYNDAGQKIQTTYEEIHSDNSGSTNAHIGTNGELRLAKAAWVLMARMAGWDGNPAGVTTYTIGGSITGQTSSVVLQNNSGNNLTLNSGTNSFIFSSPVSAGGAYNVTVSTQPTGQFCYVENGSGTANTNISNIAVSCCKIGDTDCSGVVNVQDIQNVIRVVLGLEANQAKMARANANGDGIVNIQDIQRIITIVLGG